MLSNYKNNSFLRVCLQNVKHVQMRSQISWLHSWRSTETETHTHLEWHIRFPCLLWAYRSMNCDQRKQGLNSSPNEGGWGPQSSLRNVRQHVCTHTYAKGNVPPKEPFLDCLFGHRKRARACVYLIVHKREVTQALNPGGRVTAVTMCCGVCVRRSFFRIKCSVLVLPVCDTDISRKAEEQTMS